MADSLELLEQKQNFTSRVKEMEAEKFAENLAIAKERATALNYADLRQLLDYISVLSSLGASTNSILYYFGASRRNSTVLIDEAQ